MEKDTEQYDAVKRSNIDAILQRITGASDGTDLSQVDLTDGARRYVKSLGLSDDECEVLRAHLAKDDPAHVDAEADDPGTDTPATYTVAAGDCLWKIARKMYGTGTRWKEIYEANRQIIRSPQRIYVGQVLTIPAVGF